LEIVSHGTTATEVRGGRVFAIFDGRAAPSLLPDEDRSTRHDAQTLSRKVVKHDNNIARVSEHVSGSAERCGLFVKAINSAKYKHKKIENQLNVELAFCIWIIYIYFFSLKCSAGRSFFRFRNQCQIVERKNFKNFNKLQLRLVTVFVKISKIGPRRTSARCLFRSRLS